MCGLWGWTLHLCWRNDCRASGDAMGLLSLCSALLSPATWGPQDVFLEGRVLAGPVEAHSCSDCSPFKHSCALRSRAGCDEGEGPWSRQRTPGSQGEGPARNANCFQSTGSHRSNAWPCLLREALTRPPGVAVGFQFSDPLGVAVPCCVFPAWPRFSHSGLRKDSPPRSSSR